MSELIPIAYYTWKELGIPLLQSIRQSRQLKRYLAGIGEDELVKFHRQYSTLPIPCREATGVPHADVRRALRDDLKSGAPTWTILLGDVGSGKTATLYHVYADLADDLLLRSKRGAPKRVPVFLRLRDNWRAEDLEERLRSHLGAVLTHRLLNKPQQLVLLLDGLDELGALGLEHVVTTVLNSPLLRRCRLIISTRPNAVVDLDRLETHRNVFAHQYWLYDLQSESVREYVAHHGRLEAYDHLRHDVRRLLSKPLFLYFYVTASQGAATSGRKNIDFSDEAQLYEWFFHEWYAREQGHLPINRLLPESKVVSSLLESIANTLARSTTGTIDEEELRKSTAALVSSSPDIGLFLNSLLGSAHQPSLLVSRFDGSDKNFRFIHGSLADYFQGGPIARAYSDGSLQSDWRVREMALLFAKAQIWRQPDPAECIRRNVTALQTRNDVSFNPATALSIVLWLERGSEALGLSAVDSQWLLAMWRELGRPASALSVAIAAAVRRAQLGSNRLDDLVLHGYDLSQYCDLSLATIERCTFGGGRLPFNLTSANLEKATLNDCVLDDVALAHGSLVGSALTSCVLRSTGFQRAVFRTSALRSCRFEQCDLSSVDFSSATLEDVVFENCDLVGATLNGVKLRTLTFRACNLNQAIWNDLDKRKVSFEDCDNLPPEWQ